MTKDNAKQLIADNREIDRLDWIAVTGMSARSFYNYYNEIWNDGEPSESKTRKSAAIPKGELQQQVLEMAAKVEQFDGLEIEVVELRDKVEQYRVDFIGLNQEEIRLKNLIADIDEYNNKLILKNNTLQSELDAENMTTEILQKRYDEIAKFAEKNNANLVDANLQIKKLQSEIEEIQKNAKLQEENLQNEIEELKLCKTQLENDVMFYTQEIENEQIRTSSIGYKATWILVIVILCTNFKNVWNGIAGVETDSISAFLFCAIFSSAGFCIMQLQNASRALKLCISFLCIFLESLFAASAIYANTYKIDENGKETISNIIIQLKTVFSATAQHTAIYFSLFLSLTICTILYCAINLLTKK
jgi:hypothetical protein